MHWDAEFLEDRAHAAEQAAKQAQFDADWQQATAQVTREASDTIGCFRVCPLRACHRARRCCGGDPSCVKRSGHTVPPDVLRTLIDEVYAEIQDARREAEEEEEEEEEVADANAC